MDIPQERISERTGKQLVRRIMDEVVEVIQKNYSLTRVGRFTNAG